MLKVNQKKFIFTDMDLDGAMSYMLFLWFNKKYIPYISTRVTDFNRSIQGWTKYHKFTDYGNVYILDLDISQDSIHEVDHQNVVIIDHHDTHVDNKHKYTKAKTFIKSHTSCCRYIYDLLAKNSDVKLTDRQKYLMLLVDDYDCYKLQLKHTRQLNHIFWNYQGDRVSKFVERFKHGFDNFTDDEEAIIRFYEKKIQRVISELTTFCAEVPILGQTYNFASTFATECINDVADHIIHHNGVDIGIVINTRSNKVSFRKKKGVDLDLSLLAKKLCNGGGHKYASGGTMTPTFLTFSKLFKPIK